MKDFHTIYFSFIHDADEKSRSESERVLADSKDPYIKELYEAGKGIWKIVRHEDADPAALDSAVERMKRLPLLDYWKGFIEISGQVVIGKALSVGDKERRRELLARGLKMLSVATFGAFPLSDYSRDMIRKARLAEPSLAENADAILMSIKGFEQWKPKERAVRPGAEWKKSVA